MKENVIQTNGGIAITVDVSVNNVIYVKTIIFGFLLHVVVKMCHRTKKQELFQQFLMKKI